MTRLNLLLTGLATLACSCSTQPSGPGQKADSSLGNGGNPTGGSSGLGGGGHGSGGSGGAAGGSRETTGGTGAGGQAGSSAGGGSGSGAGGSGSGGASTADAATNRDTTADLPSPDMPAKLDAATEFWTSPFVANCTPPAIGGRAQSDGHHRAGEDCMQSGCHAAGSPDAGAAFLFSGTVRRAGSLAPYASVEVAVKTQSQFYSACSATNGNFWIAGVSAGSIDWNTATARVRSSNGETAMLPAPEAGCNSCHNQTLLMTAP